MSADKKVILKIDQLCRDYGTLRVVDRLSFEVFNGEFFSLLGPSGCGKSTTLRLIAGLEEPDGGEICLKDEVVASSRDGRFVPAERRNIGLVFQSYAVWPHMTVKQNVSYPLELRRWKKDKIHGRIEQVLEAVGLSGFADRRPTELSGGQQQRLALARCLAYEPDLLLLDEPLSNVDARLREQLRLELKRIQQSMGVTIVYVTHDQSEAMALSHRIAVMQSGKIEQIGTPEEVYTRPATFFVQNFVGRLITFQGRLRKKGSTTGRGIGGSHRIAHRSEALNWRGDRRCLYRGAAGEYRDHGAPAARQIRETSRDACATSLTSAVTTNARSKQQAPNLSWPCRPLLRRKKERR